MCERTARAADAVPRPALPQSIGYRIVLTALPAHHRFLEMHSGKRSERNAGSICQFSEEADDKLSGQNMGRRNPASKSPSLAFAASAPKCASGPLSLINSEAPSSPGGGITHAVDFGHLWRPQRILQSQSPGFQGARYRGETLQEPQPRTTCAPCPCRALSAIRHPPHARF